MTNPNPLTGPTTNLDLRVWTAQQPNHLIPSSCPHLYVTFLINGTIHCPSPLCTIRQSYQLSPTHELDIHCSTVYYLTFHAYSIHLAVPNPPSLPTSNHILWLLSSISGPANLISLWPILLPFRLPPGSQSSKGWSYPLTNTSSLPTSSFPQRLLFQHIGPRALDLHAPNLSQFVYHTLSKVHRSIPSFQICHLPFIHNQLLTTLIEIFRT